MGGSLRIQCGLQIGGQSIATAMLASLTLTMLAAAPAVAQIGDSIPHAPYYVAVQAIYSGEYRDAERGLRLESRRGIRTTQARWIDTICYHAMLGEVLYHQGRNAEALAEFDQACQVILAYPNWLLQVQFQAQPPRPDLARARRPPPWGQSSRSFTLGQFPETEQVFIGELDPRRALREGGVVRTPMLWRVNVVEVLRTSALAIRRRSEILGPLAAHDPIAKELSTVFARGNLSPPNHWSSAWIDVLRGVAQAGAGKLDEADMLLGRSLTVDGQFDHPLTCVALLEQGRIAMSRGDGQRAAQLLAEAGFSAYYYDDWDALTESVWLGWVNHLSTSALGVYPPLDPVAAWAQLNRLQHIATKLRLAHAESLLWLGQVDASSALLDEAARRIGELRRGLAGIHLLYLQANLQLARGQFAPGGETLAQALAAQAGVSLRNFQIGRTSEMYDARAVSPRVAVDLYGALLADPTPANWTLSPLDAMAVLQTPQDAAFDRWFIATLERKDTPLALEVAEMAKRRRFLASVPLGGRLLALRTILESPQNELSRTAMLQRQQLLATFPVYRQLVEAAAPMYDALRAGPVIGNDAAETKKLDAQYDAWAKNAGQRLHLLLQLAPRRVPTSLEFPPLRNTAELQKMLDDGEALVEFHSAAGELYGFLVTNTGTHVWQIGDVRRLRTGVADFLRALGNYGPNRPLSAEELSSDRWRKMAADAFSAVFSAARLDLAKTKSLIIVPDDLLWYLPLEALVPDAARTESTLADQLPIRYGPTAALAMSDPRALRRTQHTGIVANDFSLGANEADTQAMLAEFEQAAVGALRLPAQLPVASNLLVPLLDSLVVLDDVDPARLAGIGSLLPRGRGTAADAAEGAVALPYGGPQHVIVTGFTTAAEQGLRPSRRNAARDVRPGSEAFQFLCGMMSTGARTIVLSRWRTGGRTNLELVREYVRELPQLPATEAWQRARLLTREAPVDPLNEPRLKGVDDEAELPTADHPFFWAGYLLVDTGPRQPEDEKANDSEKENAAMPEGGAQAGSSAGSALDVMKEPLGQPTAPPTAKSASSAEETSQKQR
jgi:hypothetical protein